MKVFKTLLVSLCLIAPVAAIAQAASIALAQKGFDGSQPVEVTADALSIDQTSGKAVFDGNVLVVQGEVRMSAGKVEVTYATDQNGAPSGIAMLQASGGITFVTASEAVEAREAIYSVEDSTVTMAGDVLLTQGNSAIAGDRLVVNLTQGTGQMEGRVRTVFSPSGDN